MLHHKYDDINNDYVTFYQALTIEYHDMKMMISTTLIFYSTKPLQ